MSLTSLSLEMNALPTIPMLNPTLLKISGFGGWNAATVAALGEGSAGYANRMAEAAAATRSPSHLNKRRRLSRLLDKLAVQIRNNNHYPSPPWLMLDAPFYEQGDHIDDAPLDLSLKSELPPPTVVTEPVSPKKETLDQPSYVCGACGQAFSIQDRLAKHIASRHRGRTPDSARAYECDICHRRFARSDMLTRHARLHSGVKPYSCSACGQVFSRSDHLATHQRTHTGEKPYRCSLCAYAACRRDMITRHMRTHSRHSQPA